MQVYEIQLVYFWQCDLFASGSNFLGFIMIEQRAVHPPAKTSDDAEAARVERGKTLQKKSHQRVNRKQL